MEELSKNPPGPNHASEGYLLLAVERQAYLDMAVQLARSIRVFDPHRAIALVVDPSIVIDAQRTIFDHVITMQPKPDYVGVMNKLRLFDVSPFNRTLFIDSDCLMTKAGVSSYWASFISGCNTLGEVMVEGEWKGLNVADIIKTLSLPYMVKMNAGVLFFDRTPLSRNIFSYMEELVTLIPKGITAIHQRRPGQYSMEPLLGAALAKFGVEPMKILPGVGSLMVSTLYARRVTINPRLGVSYLEKPNASSFYQTLLPYRTKWTIHSPIIMHFVGLKPNAIYKSACEELACLASFE